MAVRLNIRLRTLDEYVAKRHGAQRALTPHESNAIYDFADRMLQYIKDRWPVDTGTSRDRWTYVLNGTPGQMGLTIENPMFYAEYVHYAGGSDDSPLWETLLPEAFNMVKDALMAAVLAAVDKTEQRIDRDIQRGRTRRQAALQAQRGGDPSAVPSIDDLLSEFFGV